MKMIILIGLLLSVITVAPKSIQQKAEGNVETLDQGPAEIKNREEPATLESRNENGEEQVQKRRKLQKILRTRQSQAKENEQEAFKKAMIEELLRAAIEAADPESHTSRQDFSWKDVKSWGSNAWKKAKSWGSSAISGAKSFISSGISKVKSIASTAMDMYRKVKPIAKRLLNKYLHDKASGKKVKECFENKGITDTIEMVQALWIKVCKTKLKKLPFPIDCEDQDRRSRDQEIQQSQAKENEQKAFRKALEVLIRSEREAADSQTNATRQDWWVFGDGGDDEKKQVKQVKKSLTDGWKCIKDHAKLGEIASMIVDEVKELGELEEVAEE